MRPRHDARVYLFHCDGYDVARIRAITRQVMEELDLRPRGRTLLKPNLVAAGELFRHAYTRPEVAEGVLAALKDRDAGGMTELAVGERCAITIPTTYAFKESGFDAMMGRANVKRYCFDEVPQVEVRYTHERRLRDYVYVPEPVAKADFFVNVPKLKAHPWTTVTFGMKNYIGIQDDRHRLIDHDHALDRKVADLQHVIQPQLTVIDGIVAGEGRMLTPSPRVMNLLVLGDNQLAVDAVTSRIIGVEPRDVAHLRMAHEDGFGPIDAADIRVLGDLPFEAAKERAKGFEVGLVRVEKYFEGTRVSAYAGPPPSHEKDGYCWGGCPGVLEEVIELLRLFDAECDKKMPRLHLVLGHYEGALDVRYGEKVVFIGDCCTWRGALGSELVTISNKYKERSQYDPHTAEDRGDAYARIGKAMLRVNELRAKGWTRLEGCPVSVGELIFVLAQLGGIKNPYFDESLLVGFNVSYAGWKLRSVLKKFMGTAYQVQGEAPRGDAKPELGGA